MKMLPIIIDVSSRREGPYASPRFVRASDPSLSVAIDQRHPEPSVPATNMASKSTTSMHSMHKSWRRKVASAQTTAGRTFKFDERRLSSSRRSFDAESWPTEAYLEHSPTLSEIFTVSPVSTTAPHTSTEHRSNSRLSTHPLESTLTGRQPSAHLGGTAPPPASHLTYTRDDVDEPASFILHDSRNINRGSGLSRKIGLDASQSIPTSDSQTMGTPSRKSKSGKFLGKLSIPSLKRLSLRPRRRPKSPDKTHQGSDIVANTVDVTSLELQLMSDGVQTRTASRRSMTLTQRMRRISFAPRQALPQYKHTDQLQLTAEEAVNAPESLITPSSSQIRGHTSQTTSEHGRAESISVPRVLNPVAHPNPETRRSLCGSRSRLELGHEVLGKVVTRQSSQASISSTAKRSPMRTSSDAISQQMRKSSSARRLGKQRAPGDFQQPHIDTPAGSLLRKPPHAVHHLPRPAVPSAVIPDDSLQQRSNARESARETPSTRQDEHRPVQGEPSLPRLLTVPRSASFVAAESSESLTRRLRQSSPQNATELDTVSQDRCLDRPDVAGQLSISAIFGDRQQNNPIAVDDYGEKLPNPHGESLDDKPSEPPLRRVVIHNGERRSIVLMAESGSSSEEEQYENGIFAQSLDSGNGRSTSPVKETDSLLTMDIDRARVPRTPRRSRIPIHSSRSSKNSSDSKTAVGTFGQPIAGSSGSRRSHLPVSASIYKKRPLPPLPTGQSTRALPPRLETFMPSSCSHQALSVAGNLTVTRPRCDSGVFAVSSPSTSSEVPEPDSTPTRGPQSLAASAALRARQASQISSASITSSDLIRGAVGRGITSRTSYWRNASSPDDAYGASDLVQRHERMGRSAGEPLKSDTEDEAHEKERWARKAEQLAEERAEQRSRERSSSLHRKDPELSPDLGVSPLGRQWSRSNRPAKTVPASHFHHQRHIERQRSEMSPLRSPT